ncbi:PA2169 family four-helix-bundle protein [Microvirga sp. STR05]|uniref:PA2169 family four-helix-bundle protein n=1 Tax=Hymenobacter duratus TaxID=2771356 RepID=A0ABR8JIZ3_9BACT|nr:PA2169 family four-helix-bundle protein [Hymenobacter duratus]MBD2716826.1 PA2169 family four-helix-bundle protein [Hymenobacter duratus]MBR7951742.1 PA2169 family four-helix-bundle protein [Microvirga sp. STR05]
MAAITSETARAYNDLVEINKTAAKGYQEAAEEVSDANLKSKLSQMSQQRAQFAAALTQHAQQFGINPAQESTVEATLADAAAAVHRGWINIKSAITGQDDSAILGECENGDSVALQSYETALKSQELPAEARTVIEHQHGSILSDKNWITQQKATR